MCTHRVSSPAFTKLRTPESTAGVDLGKLSWGMVQGNIPFGNIPEAPAGLPRAEEGATWPQRISGDGPGTSHPAKSRVAWGGPEIGVASYRSPPPLHSRYTCSSVTSLGLFLSPSSLLLISIPSLMSIALQQQSVNIALHPTPDKPPLIS